MRAIIYGIAGQDGYYLADILRNNNIEVTGVSRSSGNWLQGDIRDFTSVEKLIKDYKPDYLFHFAANSVTVHDALFENHETISTGTFNILEAVYRHSRHTRVFLSGSAVQFKNCGLAINEDTPFSALSPYAVARIQSVYAGRYFRNLSIKVYIGYFFHHDSSLRSIKHINQKIVKTVQKIADGKHETLEIGNLSARKEFNFAKDFMEAVWILVNQDKVFECVIGSGKHCSLKDWVECCFRLVDMDSKGFIKKNPDSKTDYNIIYSDPSRIISLGWKPKVDMEKLCFLMMNNQL
jgi:GDPmannose 4,6-dehydratase